MSEYNLTNTRKEKERKVKENSNLRLDILI